MDNIIKHSLILAFVGVSIGIIGLVSFHNHTKWLFVTCAALCLCQFVINIVSGMIQAHSYPLLFVCTLIGFYVSGSFFDSLCYGICLYYAVALFYLGVLMVVPLHIILLILSIVSIVSYFINAEQVFVSTGLYCTSNFIIALLRGSLPRYAMDVFIFAVVIGVFMLFQRNLDTYSSIKILKGVLWGGAAYYIFALAAAAYYLKKQNDR